MRTLAFLTAILYLYGCSVEPVALDLERGTLAIKGAFYIPSPTSKTPVPECSNLTPNVIRYIMTSNGQQLSRDAAITFTGNNFTADPIELPAGTYTVTDVGLYNANTLTHVIPEEGDPRFPFHEYVDNPLPYTLTILPEQTTTDRPEVMCYTFTEIPNLDSAEFGLEGEHKELGTENIWISPESCIDAISIQLVGGNEIMIAITTGNAFGLPVPVDAVYHLRAYYDGVVVYEQLNQTLPESETGDPVIRIIHSPCT